MLIQSQLLLAGCLFAMSFDGCIALSENSCSFIHPISHWFDIDTAIQNTTAQKADNFTQKKLKPEAQGLSEQDSPIKTLCHEDLPT